MKHLAEILLVFVSQGSREQLAIAEFARSLLVIPKTLAVNAAQDSTDLVAKLRAFHNEAQVNPERKNLKWWVLTLLHLAWDSCIFLQPALNLLS